MIAVTEAETNADCAEDGDDKVRLPFLGCGMDDVSDDEEPNGKQQDSDYVRANAELGLDVDLVVVLK